MSKSIPGPYPEQSIPFCEFVGYEPTCFEKYGTREWLGLMGNPILDKDLLSTVSSYANLIDHRYVGIVKRDKCKRVYACENLDCEWEVEFVRPSKGVNKKTPFVLRTVSPEHNITCPKLMTVKSVTKLRNL